MCIYVVLINFISLGVDEEQMMKPVKFDGQTFLRFPNMVYRM